MRHHNLDLLILACSNYCNWLTLDIYFAFSKSWHDSKVLMFTAFEKHVWTRWVIVPLYSISVLVSSNEGARSMLNITASIFYLILACSNHCNWLTLDTLIYFAFSKAGMIARFLCLQLLQNISEQGQSLFHYISGQDFRTAPYINCVYILRLKFYSCSFFV